MKKKLRIGILFGGRSGEHEVSLLSAASILKAIDRKKYEVVPIAIDKQGRWLCGDQAQRLLAGPAPALLSAASEADLEFATAAAVLRCGEPLHIPPPHPMRRATDRLERSTGAHLAQPGNPLAASLDVVFPVLHGTFGEDGTIQGLFELADIAYVGSGVLGSSAAMDKDAMKRLFAAAGLPQTPHVALLRSQWRADPKRATRLIEKSLRYPLFVKPANLGSSVGISKVHARSELAAAINLAARFDRKLIVEQGVGGPGVKPREFEVAVLGNDEPQASVVGEIVPNKRVLRLRLEVRRLARRPVDPHHPRQTHPLRVEAGPRDCPRRLPRLRLRRPGPRRLPHGTGDKRRSKPAAREQKKPGLASFSARSTPCPDSPASRCIPSSGRPAVFLTGS